MSTQAVSDHFAKLVEKCAATEAGREMIGMYNHIVQFTLLDGDKFHLIAENGKTSLVAGQMPERPLDEGYEIKGDTHEFEAWFSGRERLSDLVENGRMFPVASHTTKRHIDYWLAQIVRLGNGLKIPKEVY